jgi:hypothetical protein
MTREELIERLLALPARLAEAEADALEEGRYLAQARRTLQVAEDRCLLARDESGAPALNGRNAEERAAQLRLLTAPERGQVEYREERQARAASELRARKRSSAPCARWRGWSRRRRRRGRWRRT